MVSVSSRVEDPDGNNGEEKDDRGQWGNQLEFILTCVG